MNKIILSVLTLTIFIYWDFLIRIRYIISRSSIEKWVDSLFYRICSLLFNFTALLVNVHIHFEKTEDLKLPETFILISNHQSIQDIPLLIWSFPKHNLRFSAKGSLFKYIPMVSIMLRIQQHGKIDRRGNALDTLKTLERVGLKSKHGYCPIIFPEGTRAKDGNLRTFHSGAVKKMINVNSIPVVTVAIEGGWRVGDVKGLIKNMSDFNYHIKILDTYDAPKSKKEVQEIINSSHENIKKQVEIWREQDSKSPKTSKGCHRKPY